MSPHLQLIQIRDLDLHGKHTSVAQHVVCALSLLGAHGKVTKLDDHRAQGICERVCVAGKMSSNGCVCVVLIF